MERGRRKVVKLAGRLDTAAAAKLKRLLISRRGSNLSLDASAVVMLGAVCAEVIFSAAQLWRQDDRVLNVVSPSVSWTENLELLGFTAELLPVRS